MGEIYELNLLLRYYNRSDLRDRVAGDMWVWGMNCWSRAGFTRGTPVLNNCFNIGLNGNINIPYGLTTPGIATDIIIASTLPYLTMATSVTITGNITTNGHCITRGFNYDYSPVAVAQNSNAVLS